VRKHTEDIEKKISAKIIKSICCLAYVLTNWAAFYFRAYPRDISRVGAILIPFLTDVWRWLPAVMLVGVLAILLLIIWKPFANKILILAVLCVAVVMVAVLVFAVATWENFGAANPQYLDTTMYINYNETFFQEFMRIARWTTDVHLTTSVALFAVFLGFWIVPIIISKLRSHNDHPHNR